MSDAVPLHVGLLSLERWDGVWRRNQHLANQLIEQGIVDRITFVEPTALARTEIGHPLPGITTVRPRLALPRRAGGLRLLARTLRRGPLHDADLLWINDAPLGRWVARPDQPAFYDVTDDWRESTNTDRVRRRLITAEDWLSANVSTVVCSAELARRWTQRYGVEPTVVPNGVDLRLWEHVVPVALAGRAPHLGYVGSLHADRLDIALVVELAQSPAVGTVHLVGPDFLGEADRARLDAAGVRRPGPVTHTEVPGWMRAFDVLICPHRVTPFTLSLDAIKAYEYAIAGKPVVATPTSGLQALATPGWSPTDRSDFVARAAALLADQAGPAGLPGAVDWEIRGKALGEVLSTLLASSAKS